MSSKRISMIALCLGATGGVRVGVGGAIGGAYQEKYQNFKSWETEFARIEQGIIEKQNQQLADLKPEEKEDKRMVQQIRQDAVQELKAAMAAEKMDATYAEAMLMKQVSDAQTQYVEKKETLLGLIRNGTVGKVMRNKVPQQPLYAADFVAALQDPRGGELLAEMSKVRCTAPPGKLEAVDDFLKYMNDTYNKASRDHLEHCIRFGQETAANGGIKFVDRLPKDEGDNFVTYLSAQPIYATGADGCKYVDGVEALARVPNGTHTAPGALFMKDSYQAADMADKANGGQWAQFQIRWMLHMAQLLNGRVNYVSGNMRLNELVHPMVRQSIMNAVDQSRHLGTTLMFEITEYDRYEVAKHWDVIKELLDYGAVIALDDLVPFNNREEEFAAFFADEAEMKAFKTFKTDFLGKYSENADKFGAPHHATTYSLGRHLQTLPNPIRMHKSCGKHSQRLLQASLMTWNTMEGFTITGGNWKVPNEENRRQFQMVNAFTNADGALKTDDSRFLFVNEYLQYVIDTLVDVNEKITQAETKNKDLPQNEKIDIEKLKLFNFVIEVSILPDVVNQSGNEWFRQIVREAEANGVSLFSSQGGESGDMGFPAEVFDIIQQQFMARAPLIRAP